MKNKLTKEYLNNISDLLILYEDDKFKQMLKQINNINIPINSHLIHKEPTISHQDNLIFNVDNYISFVKNSIKLNPQEIRYIISLTLYENNNCLFKEKYYYDDIDYYNKQFIKMLMYKYNNNYKILSKFIKIKKRNFEDLIKIINKKRSYAYFENINYDNIIFYKSIIESLESN